MRELDEDIDDNEEFRGFQPEQAVDMPQEERAQGQEHRRRHNEHRFAHLLLKINEMDVHYAGHPPFPTPATPRGDANSQESDDGVYDRTVRADEPVGEDRGIVDFPIPVLDPAAQANQDLDATTADALFGRIEVTHFNQHRPQTRSRRVPLGFVEIRGILHLPILIGTDEFLANEPILFDAISALMDYSRMPERHSYRFMVTLHGRWNIQFADGGSMLLDHPGDERRWRLTYTDGRIHPRHHRLAGPDFERFQNWLTGSLNDYHDYNRNGPFLVEGVTVAIAQAGVTGGCRVFGVKTHHILGNGMFVYDPTSKNNNCIVLAINYGASIVKKDGKQYIAGMTIRNLRSIAGLDPNEEWPSTEECLRPLSNFFGVRIEVFTSDLNGEKMFVSAAGSAALPTVKLFNSCNHYYFIENEKFVSHKCYFCGSTWVKTHNCSVKKSNFVMRMNLGHTAQSGRFINPKKVERTPEGATPRFISIDFETGPMDNNAHIPFFIGAKDVNGNYWDFFGEECWERFFDRVVMEPECFCDVPWVAFNGRRFDFQILIRLMSTSRHKFEIVNILFKDGNILNCKVMLTVGEKKYKICFWDLISFIPMSLEKAIEAFGITNISKQVFPYLFIDSWERVRYVGPPPGDEYYVDKDKHRIPRYPEGYEWSTYLETKKYLKADVECLYELVKSFWTVINQYFDHINVFDYVTMPQLAYQCWKRTVEPFTVQEITSKEMDKFVRSGMYGGRVVLNWHEWQSEQYVDILMDKIDYEDVTDYAEDEDMNSMYTWVMTEESGCTYPLGIPRWWPIRNGQVELTELPKNAKWLARVTVTPNQDIKVALLQRRNKEGLICYDLKRRTGTYTSDELLFAMENGYVVNYWHRMVVWPASGFPMHVFVTQCNNLRQQAKAEKNDALNVAAKLAGNSTYGGLAKRASSTKTVPVTNEKQLHSFFEKHEWKDYIIVNNDLMFMQGDVLPKNKHKHARVEESQARPVQLGVWVTSHARVEFLKIQKKINPTLNDRDYMPLYCDTDSMHIHRRAVEKMRELGLLDSKRIGAFKNDIAEGCKVIRGRFPNPKTYTEEYILPDFNETRMVYSTIHGKGLPTRLLTTATFDDLFEQNQPTVFSFQSLWATSLLKNPTGTTQPMRHYNLTRTRTFGMTPYSRCKLEPDGTYSLYKIDEDVDPTLDELIQEETEADFRDDMNMINETDADDGAEAMEDNTFHAEEELGDEEPEDGEDLF
jgi:hypothetical protein